MKLPLRIGFRNMDTSPAVEAAIRERAGRLDRFFDRIIGCRVTVEAPHKHQRKGKLYAVTIDLTVPGDEIVVNHTSPRSHAHEDVYVAIRDAFNAATRLLEEHARKSRGDVKTHEAPQHGEVARLFPREGYGFIKMADGREVYFHRNSVTAAGFDRLEIGDEVRLTVAEGESPRGPQASVVTAVGKHHVVG